MKRGIGLLIAAAVSVILTGCMGGVMVRKDDLATTNKIAVVSVVLPRIADSARESNKAALQAAADRALVQIETGLRTVHAWTVVDAAGFKGSAKVMSVAAVTEEEMATLLPKGGEGATARDQVKRELARWKTDFTGAKGLPVVPYSGLVPGKGDKTAAAARISAFLQQHAARLCAALNVDAVAFVHIAAGISHPRPKTFIVSNNRTDGALRAAQTLVIVNKAGRIIVNMGLPVLGDRARTRDLLPLYVGSGQDAVKQENIDLGDPKHKIAQAFSSLMDETAADLVQAFKKAAEK